MEIVRQADSEKLTLNIGYVDLGKIDLLVREGFYSNRSDFIRTAIRNQLAAQASDVRQVGHAQYLRHGPPRLQPGGAGRMQTARRETVDPRRRTGADRRRCFPADLAAETIESITVLGALQASDAVKTALAGKLK